MAFLYGTFSAQRFFTHTVTEFEEAHIDALKLRSVHRSRPDAEGVEVGWGGIDHEEDGEFSFAKCVRGEFMHFAVRVTTDKPPAGKVRVAYQTELKAIVAEAGVEVPTSDMKREARESAEAKLAEDGKDGRWRKHKVIPVVWDGKTGQVWLGTPSHTHAGRFMALFQQTFADLGGAVMEPVTSGTLAAVTADLEGCEFAFGEAPVWCPDGCDWLGNEFALWLLWKNTTDCGDERLEVPVVMRQLRLACPDGAGGCDTFAHEMPQTLPEVGRALQEGKLPRTVGLTLTDPDAVTALTLDPELWTVSGVKVPEVEDVPPGPQRELARLEQCRSVFAALDGVYSRFLDARFEGEWPAVVGQINNWTGRVPAGVS